MSSFLLHLRVSHRCQALMTVSDCPSLPTPAFTTEQPVGRVGLPSNFMPTSLCPHNPSSLSATTFLLAKTVPDLLFLGVDLKDLKAETGLAQRKERRRRSQVRFWSRACTLVADTSPVGGVREAADRCLFLINVSDSLFLSLFLPLCKKSIKIYLK
uniref:Uncharacterized protein n=1 Tax=Pipistrellus kuhlii TaxID=59472 RepID=A0A7J7W381_PIPKU|nr:hypothetical protein mPipKuh1_008160 [Pipistrellus kuhlii]